MFNPDIFHAAALLIGALLGLIPLLWLRANSASQLASATADKQSGEARIAELQQRLQQTEQRLQQVQDQLQARSSELAQLQARQQEQQQAATDKLKLLEDARGQLTTQFKQLSQEILEEKSRRFTEQNQAGLKQILDPLKERIAGFEKQVSGAYDKESRDRIALFEQIRTLKDLNQQVADDARNLTKALRGESKTQGNWGEMILERILEASGLSKGREYETQFSAEGASKRPDAVVHLPEGRDIVIDAKVSLTAYVNATESEDEAVREAAMKEHVASVRRQVLNLSAKDYQHIDSIRSPDFVLMFVPSESAFIEAIRRDPKLHEEAMARNVGLVSPSTLLPTLRTVEYLWRVDRQNNNAKEIARQAGKLYDKFVGFTEDMNKLGERLKQATASFDDASNKLSSGRGNLVGRAEKLYQLGAAASKRVDAKLLAAEEDGPEALSAAPQQTRDPG